MRLCSAIVIDIEKARVFYSCLFALFIKMIMYICCD
nr:MAG TPA: hypothetical protein [Caudoviricetes sp.]